MSGTADGTTAPHSAQATAGGLSPPSPEPGPHFSFHDPAEVAVGAHYFPWYDSYWLAQYVSTKAWIAREDPASLAEFLARYEGLRTRQDFRTHVFRGLFDAAVLAEMRAQIAALDPQAIEDYEGGSFGRGLLRNHPWFTDLQARLVGPVSDAAGEALEIKYNFLGLYGDRGICAPHLDAPNAKWTLDVCIDQSGPWPIHISQVVPWPEEYRFVGPDWERAIINDPDLRFEPYVLEPGDAVLFSGSSQWHYRDRQPGGPGAYYHLIFFHFVPRGLGPAVDTFPGPWDL